MQSFFGEQRLGEKRFTEHRLGFGEQRLGDRRLGERQTERRLAQPFFSERTFFRAQGDRRLMATGLPAQHELMETSPEAPAVELIAKDEKAPVEAMEARVSKRNVSRFCSMKVPSAKPTEERHFLGVKKREVWLWRKSGSVRVLSGRGVFDEADSSERGSERRKKKKENHKIMVTI